MQAAWLAKSGFARIKNLRNGVPGLKISVSISFACGGMGKHIKASNQHVFIPISPGTFIRPF